MTACEFVRPLAAIEHNAHICNALLLIFICIQRIAITRARPPVDRTWRITRLVFTYAEELGPTSAGPGRDCPGIDARATRADRNVTDACHWWEHEQASLRIHADLRPADP